MKAKHIKRLKARAGDLIVWRDARGNRAESILFQDSPDGDLWFGPFILWDEMAMHPGNAITSGNIEVLEVYRSVSLLNSWYAGMTINGDGSRVMHEKHRHAMLRVEKLALDTVLYQRLDPEADAIWRKIKSFPVGTWFEAISDDGHRRVWFATGGGYASGWGQVTQTNPNPRWVTVRALTYADKKKGDC